MAGWENNLARKKTILLKEEASWKKTPPRVRKKADREKKG